MEHYSSAVRLELVRHLKKSLTDYPDLICSHLNLLIERLSWLITDVDAQVRKQGISLLKLVLSNADPDHILPFFPVVVAHLRCALTHISHDIQKDGLPLVDLLVDTFPQHLKYFSKHLLQDFLNQISSQIKPFLTANSNNAHTIKRVLTSDPARKIVGIQWYLQVCRRLQNVLKGIFKSSSGTQSINLSDSGKIIKWENIDEKLTWPIYTNEVTTEAYSRR